MANADDHEETKSGAATSSAAADASAPNVPISVGRLAATVLMTLVVVAAEFLLLSYVYQRAAPVRAQRIIVAELQGRLVAAPTAAVLHAVPADLTRLGSAGSSAAQLSGVRTAAFALVARRTDARAVGRLRAATSALATRLAEKQRSLDRQAEASYVILLVLASFGWMIWFRRLVTRHRALQAVLSEQEARVLGEQRLASLVRNSADVITVLDADSTVSFATPSAHVVLGRRPQHLIGLRWLDVIVEKEDRALVALVLAGLRHGEEESVTMRARHSSGRLIYLEGTLTSLLADPTVQGLVLTVRDVTQRRELETRLTHQAFHDSLTGLANRQLFADRLEHALTRTARGGAGVVVLFFDLDDFKQINDSVGHNVGDAVLTEVGARLGAVIRASDTAARLGGDEFAVLMEDSTLEEGYAVAERLQEALAEPVVVGAAAHIVRASVGLAEASSGPQSAADVLRNADVAMYLAKDRGKSAIAVYEPQLHAEALERMHLQADLQRALRDDQFVLYYQPVVDLKSGDIAGFEALVRWAHPDRGLVGPLDFIPVAERTGLIVPLGGWVLREACRAALAMQSDAHRPTMSVNVAAAQLAEPGFVDEVFSVLAETGLAPELLCLEVTESCVLNDIDAAIPKFEQLRTRGIRVAIDDFGTGYSSLAYLAKLPFDILKVDRAFVQSVAVAGQDTSITEAILAMSTAMRLTTIAEGIELTAQAIWLADAHCQLGQGFLWSKAVPLEQARELLDAMLELPAAS